MPSYLIADTNDDGFDNAGTWDTTGLLIPDDSWAGFRFTTLPARSVAQGSGTLWNATTILTSATLTLTAGLGQAGGTLTVYVVPETHPAAFSNSRLPNTLSEVQVGSLATGAITGGQTLSIPLTIATLTPYHRASGFQGAMAFSVHWAATSAQTLLLTEFPNTGMPTLVTEELPEITGLEGPWKAEARADRCPKCGTLSTRDTWVRDGYTKMMVCPNCWDPVDDTGRFRPSREGPPIGEG